MEPSLPSHGRSSRVLSTLLTWAITAINSRSGGPKISMSFSLDRDALRRVGKVMCVYSSRPLVNGAVLVLELLSRLLLLILFLALSLSPKHQIVVIDRVRGALEAHVRSVQRLAQLPAPPEPARRSHLPPDAQILIVGAASVGKSRLALALQRQARRASFGELSIAEAHGETLPDLSGLVDSLALVLIVWEAAQGMPLPQYVEQYTKQLSALHESRRRAVEAPRGRRSASPASPHSPHSAVHAPATAAIAAAGDGAGGSAGLPGGGVGGDGGAPGGASSSASGSASAAASAAAGGDGSLAGSPAIEPPGAPEGRGSRGRRARHSRGEVDDAPTTAGGASVGSEVRVEARPPLRTLVVCNKCDVMPCPMPQMQGLPADQAFIAVSAERGTNVSHLWSMAHPVMAAASHTRRAASGLSPSLSPKSAAERSPTPPYDTSSDATSAATS